MRTHWQGNEGNRDSAGGHIYALIIRNQIKSQAITVGASAVKLPTTPIDKRFSILIANNSTSGQILYLGASDVTTSIGFPVYPRAVIQLSIEDDIDIYGIASAAGADIRVFEGG